MKRPLRVIAIASTIETQQQLSQQLSELAYVELLGEGVLLELGDATPLCHSQTPDVILVELTGRELDAGLFIQAMSMDPERPSVLFALHAKQSPDLMLQTMRNGAKEFVVYPNESQALTDGLHRMHSYISRITGQAEGSNEPTPPDEQPCRVLSVFSPKGGAGSSTVAVNLAAEIKRLKTEKGEPVKVALFDMDQVFNNTAVMLNLKPTHALSSLMRTSVASIEDSVLKKLLVEHESGLELLVASKSALDDTDPLSPDLLQRTMVFLQEQYDFVVIDLPSHTLDPYHQFFVDHSDQVLVVSALDVPCLYRTRQYLDLATQFIRPDKLKLILNRHTQQAAYGMSNEGLEEEFRFPIFARLSNDWELMVEANSLGQLLREVSTKAELSVDMEKLAKAVIGDDSETLEPDVSSEGLMSKLLGWLPQKKKSETTEATAVEV